MVLQWTLSVVQRPNLDYLTCEDHPSSGYSIRSEIYKVHLLVPQVDFVLVGEPSGPSMRSVDRSQTKV